jgi:hypothetical protein
MTQDEIIELAWKEYVASLEGRPHPWAAFNFAWKAASAKEREACAKLCDDEANDDTQDEWNACNCCTYLADKIRARGEQA